MKKLKIARNKPYCDPTSFFRKLERNPEFKRKVEHKERFFALAVEIREKK